MGLEVKNLISISASKKAIGCFKYVLAVFAGFLLLASLPAYSAEIGEKAKVGSQPDEETKTYIQKLEKRISDLESLVNSLLKGEKKTPAAAQNPRFPKQKTRKKLRERMNGKNRLLKLILQKRGMMRQGGDLQSLRRGKGNQRLRQQKKRKRQKIKQNLTFQGNTS